MKKIFQMGSAALVSFSVAVLTGCKDRDTTADEMPADTTATAAPETNTTLNDSNTSGVTSGTMEQVP